MPTEFCPACEMPVHIGMHPRVGQRLACPHCSTSLEVSEVFPLELNWVKDKQPEAEGTGGGVARTGRSQLTQR